MKLSRHDFTDGCKKDSYKERHVLDKEPCVHNGCKDCNGSGHKKNGNPCVHMIHCQCPKCNPMRM